MSFINGALAAAVDDQCNDDHLPFITVTRVHPRAVEGASREKQRWLSKRHHKYDVGQRAHPRAICIRILYLNPCPRRAYQSKRKPEAWTTLLLVYTRYIDNGCFLKTLHQYRFAAMRSFFCQHWTNLFKKFILFFSNQWKKHFCVQVASNFLFNIFYWRLLKNKTLTKY